MLEVLAVMFVAPLYYGWWTLGGNARLLSPMEIALAFDAPLLKDINSATGASEAIKRLGDVEVKYGSVTTSDGRSHRLGIAESGRVMKPQKGMRFDR